MKTSTLQAIKAHAVAEYPRECCGLVIVAKGREKYIACRNAAAGTEHFILPGEDYAEAEEKGEIVAVVHSHPDMPAAPTQADRVACEASGLAWHIVGVDSVDGAPAAGEVVTISPSGYLAPLVGREFSHGVLDCYQLIVDWYKQERDISLKQFHRADDWWNDGSSDLYTEGFPQAGFVAIKDGDKPQVGDVILMQIRSSNGVPNHAGIYIGDGLMLHHLHGRLSSRDVYGGYFQEVTRAILRYKDDIVV
ncbi:C40 family peptidase [Collimonas sp. NPDC087041]|uniref:C40 family peptidase n=1 Tax=Collimonas sp. NPDC087041 TaxID=3363960 RepID=UPI0037FBB0B1